MENSKFQIESMTLRVNNSKDADRAYDINVGISRQGNGSTVIENGSASKNGTMAASFNSYGDGNHNFTFYCSASEQPAALAAINEFIEGAKAFAASKISI